MSYAKELREKQGRIAAQMRALVDKAKAAGRGLNTEERAQWSNMTEEFEANEASIKAEESLVTIETRLGSIAESEIIPALADAGGMTRQGARQKKAKDDSPHGKAFGRWLRHGLGALTPAEQQLMQSRSVALDSIGIQNAQTITGSGGGYLIPQGFSDQLEEALKFYGGIVGEVGEFTTDTGNPLPWPTENDTINKGRILAINTQLTTTDLVFGQIMFNAYTGTSDIVLVPIQLMQDSFFDMDTYVARALGTRLGRLLNFECTMGTGAGVAPTGVQPAVVAAGLITQGAVGSSTSIAYGNLVDLYHSVDPAYREGPNVKWMLADSTLKAIRHLVDTTGRPLWQPGISAGFGGGFPPTILDKPYILNNDMPAMAASAVALLFGDFSKYKLRRVAGGVTMMRLTERYADYLQVGFLGFLRFDGNLLDAGTHPIGGWQNSAT